MDTAILVSFRISFAAIPDSVSTPLMQIYRCVPVHRMSPDDAVDVIPRLQAVLEGAALRQKYARLQASALEKQRYALSKTYEMTMDMECDVAIEDELNALGFQYYSLGEDSDAELWISEEYGLMVYLDFDTNDGLFYQYRLLAFDVISESVDEGE